MKRVYIETYGCELNRGDAAIMKMILEDSGYTIVDDPKDADVIILNTCIVRYDTEVRMVKRLRELSRLGKKIVVAGCMARALPSIARKVCPDAILLVPQAVERVVEAVEAPPRSVIFEDVRMFTRVPIVVDRCIAIIPVAEGCLDECAFCIVKRARPKLKSIPIEKVVEAVKRAVEKGAIEIHITAQDLAVYGVDIYGRPAVVDLLEALLEIEREFYIRIGQMNPKYIPQYLDRLIDVLRDPRVYKHLHIPVQSGSNKVLSIMNRGHSVELFIQIVKELRKKVEGISIATDIIVGHPGEDEYSFLETVKLVLDMELDRLHIARYSLRPMTRAASMPQIPDPIKKARSSYIERVYELYAHSINLEYVGSRALCIVSETGRGSTYVCRLFNYRPVIVYSENDILGKRIVVEIENATFYDLRGRVVSVL